MTRGEIMTRVRSQVLLVKRLKEQMEELSIDGVRSMNYGGVGGGGGDARARGLDVRLEKKEALERMLAQEKKRLAEYEAAARKEMDLMKPNEYAFCLMYYIGACTIRETGRLINRSVRQCERYRSIICEE